MITLVYYVVTYGGNSEKFSNIELALAAIRLRVGQGYSEVTISKSR